MVILQLNNDVMILCEEHIIIHTITSFKKDNLE